MLLKFNIDLIFIKDLSIEDEYKMFKITNPREQRRRNLLQCKVHISIQAAVAITPNFEMSTNIV